MEQVSCTISREPPDCSFTRQTGLQTNKMQPGKCHLPGDVGAFFAGIAIPNALLTHHNAVSV